MRRASTPTHEFELPFDSSMVLRFLLTYKQGNRIILEKRESDMTVDGNIWSIKLTQEETNLFSDKTYAYAQIRVLTPGGDLLPSDIFRVYVGEVLNDEVLV